MAVINSSLDCLDWTDIGQRIVLIESGVSVRSEDTEDTRGRGLAAVWPMGTLGCRGSVSVDTRQWSPYHRAHNHHRCRLSLQRWHILQQSITARPRPWFISSEYININIAWQA